MEAILFAIERVVVLFGNYAKVTVDDADAYVAGIVTVLMRYPPDIVRAVTDPVIGISATGKYRRFIPHVGELKAFCDREVESRDTEERLRLVLQKRGCTLVLCSSPRFEAMKTRARTDTRGSWLDMKSRGVWVPKEWLQHNNPYGDGDPAEINGT